jgi:hypothetical protein
MSASASSTCAMPASSHARARPRASATDGSASCVVRVLAFRACVRGPAAIVRSFQDLRPLAPAWTTIRKAAVSTEFDIRPDVPKPGWYQLVRDGAGLHVVKSETAILGALDAAVNAAAVEAIATRYVLVHAGAVAYADKGLLLPAAAASGKTTLVAGLLAAGFQYLSDEVSILDPDSGKVLPFAKSLGVKRGGASALASAYPELASRVPRVQGWREMVWYLPPPAAVWPSRPIPVRYVVVPRYVPRARTELVPISRTAALSRVVQQSFKLHAQGTVGLAGLIGVVRQADCYALTVGQLQPAVDHLLELVNG